MTKDKAIEEIEEYIQDADKYISDNEDYILGWIDGLSSALEIVKKLKS